jgi:hypothetical protein
VDVGQVARDFGIPESVVSSVYEDNRPAPVSKFDNNVGVVSGRTAAAQESEEFKFGNTDRPEAVIDLEDLISSGYMDYGLEARLWDEFAPEFGAFDPNSPEFQAAMDELIASGVANISTAGAGTTKDIVDAILGTIDVTDGVSQEDINAAIAVLDSEPSDYRGFSCNCWDTR